MDRSATSDENVSDGTGHMPRGAGPMYGTEVKMAAFTLMYDNSHSFRVSLST